MSNYDPSNYSPNPPNLWPRVVPAWYISALNNDTVIIGGKFNMQDVRNANVLAHNNNNHRLTKQQKYAQAVKNSAQSTFAVQTQHGSNPNVRNLSFNLKGNLLFKRNAYDEQGFIKTTEDGKVPWSPQMIGLLPAFQPHNMKMNTASVDWRKGIHTIGTDVTPS